MKKIYTAIDIGTYSIKFVVLEYYNSKFYVLGSHQVKSKGIKKGLIVEPSLVIDSIKEGILEINSLLGISIDKVLVNVPDYNVSFKLVTGVTDVLENDTVTSEDISRVIKDSIYNKLDESQELVTLLPVEYKLDDEVISKPLGKNGQKLEITYTMTHYLTRIANI